MIFILFGILAVLALSSWGAATNGQTKLKRGRRHA